MEHPADVNDLLALYDQLAGDDAPRRERRQHPRTTAKGLLPATVTVPGGATAAASIKDLSRSGIGLLCPHALRTEQLVEVEFRLGSGPLRATCRVANCRLADDCVRYVIGLAFVEVRRPAQPPPPPPVPSTLSADDLPVPGEVLSAKDAMAGAEVSAVEEVVGRVSRLLRSS